MNRSHRSAWVVTGVLLNALLYVQPIVAQVIPDATLPAGERSQVTGNANVQIDGGARRGGALFHSFSEFSIPTGGGAFFNNAADVQTIFSRVTGGLRSTIDGLIQANGTANLFVLNPNGILFGPNASLNIGGSFLATTADAIDFPNGEVFSSDATQPLPNQLLSVNPNALFFNQLTPQPIINQSTFKNTGLQVPLRQNLLLVGGSVQLTNGRLISPGSYVELGGVGGIGTVGLSTTSEDWQLNIPNEVTRADVSLRNSGDINVKGDGGSIRILGQNIDIFRSSLRIEIPSNSRLPDAQTGDLELNATGSIAISNSILANSLFGQGTMGGINLTAGDRISLDRSSSVFNTVERTGVGKIGDINIRTGSLSVTNLTLMTSSTNGQGNAGSVNINARDAVSFDNYSRASSIAGTGKTGNAGDVNITTGSLSLTRVSSVNSVTNGQGDAGSVNINARDAVSFDNGSHIFARSSSVGNRLYNETDIAGNGGDVNITTGSLFLTWASFISSNTYGRQANAGNVNINARDTVSIDGTTGTIPSHITTQVKPGAEGRGGDVTITTGSLILTNGGSVYTNNDSGIGDAGNVTIQARDAIQIRGILPASQGRIFNREGFDNRSQVSTLVTRKAVGNGGSVTITTGSLSVSEDGRIATSVEGQGRAGNIRIQASTISFDRRGNAISTLEAGAGGRGGDIDIAARSLSVLNGAQLTASTAGAGNAGNISIATLDSVTLSGANASGQASGLLTTTEPSAIGRGGNIRVETRNFQVTNGALLNARSLSSGRGGDITLNADTVDLSGGGQLLTSASSSGRAGDITVNTPELQLSGATSGLFAGTTSVGDAGNLTIQPRGNGQRVRVSLQGGAQIFASTSSRGRGGTLTITAPESITLVGNGSIIAAETGGAGTGGNLILTTGTLGIQNQAEVTVSSSGTGNAGSLFVDADRIYLNNGGRIRADTSGGGGNINVRSSLILLRNGSNISTSATGDNIPGGNIGIDTRFLIAVPDEDSNISANSRDFRGGNVRINAFSIFGIQPRLNPTSLSDITATGATSALPGTIDLTTAGIDPASGLVQLPTDLVDASGLIAQGCPADKGNSFVITGRGGLPPTPDQQLDDDAEWDDRSLLTVARRIDHEREARDLISNTNTEASRPRVVPQATTAPAIIEATGWQKTATGEVILVGNTPEPTTQNSLYQPVACRGR